MSGDEALARRAVACAAWWRLMPGMRLVRPWGGGDIREDHMQVVGSEVDGAWLLDVDMLGLGDPLPDFYGFANLADWLPDLTDPATLGCLLALVREAWGNPDLGTQRVGVLADGSPEWVVRDYLGATAQFYGAGEAAALVAALEAAPKREVT